MRIRLIHYFPIVTALMLSISCSTKEQTKSSSATQSALNPKPSGRLESQESQLLRFKGQTRFLNALESYGCYGKNCRYLESSMANSKSATADGSSSANPRDIQESDIFKVGKPGSKLLYLLNNYRGLQIVSYEQGEENPLLLSRVEATGNWPDDMYYQAEKDRILVLENNWYDSDSDRYYYSTVQSRLLVYDVADSKNPRISATIDLEGSISESRMVGDILYVATSVRPYYYGGSPESQKSKGYVYAFNVASNETRQIDRHELPYALSYGDTMNIIEQNIDGQYYYYLIAVLTDDKWGWGWGSQNGIVAVVDISSPEGHITPSMIVTTRGNIRERSQTLIKDNTLIVTSNYTNEASRRRIAVESFTLPNKKSEIIDEEEATYRSLHLKRELAKLEAELEKEGLKGDALIDALDEGQKKLLADPEFGLKGRFINLSSSYLSKTVADSFISVGSTQGLNALIQDVRSQDNHLYVYWVPQNNIDPLDIFDISNPSEGIAHLSHLEFDGWIERSIPISYQNHNFIIGLGWVIPSTDERSRRYPQAVLMEVKNVRGKIKAEIVDQMQFKESGTWINFNASDKFIEVRFSDEGSGQILFISNSWGTGNYVSGGKLLGFNLNAAFTENEPIFSEGALLRGQSGWLRRVFTNPEIGRINTFSDKELATYSKVDHEIGTARDVISAVNTLELARNIRAYKDILIKGQSFGVQIISEYSYYYGSDEDKNTSEARLVDPRNADGEKPEAHSIAKFPGTLVAIEKIDENTLGIISRTYIYHYNEIAHRYTYNGKLYLSTLNGKLHKNGVSLLVSTQEFPLNYEQEELVQLSYQLNNGSILKAYGETYFTHQNNIWKLDIGANAKPVFERVGLENCEISQEMQAEEILLVGNLLLAKATEAVKPEDERLGTGARLVRYSISPVQKTGPLSLSCGKFVNIPGEVLTFDLAGKKMISDDQRLVNFKEETYSPYVPYESSNKPKEIKPKSYLIPVLERVFLSLDLDLVNSSATLKDIYTPSGLSPYSGNTEVKTIYDASLGSPVLVFIENGGEQFNTPIYGYGAVYNMRPMYSGVGNENQLTILGLDQDTDFVTTTHILPSVGGKTGGIASLAGIFLLKLPQSPIYQVFIQTGNKLQAMSLASSFTNLKPQALRKVLSSDSSSESAEYFKMAPSSWWYGELAVNYNEFTSTVEFANGLMGVSQYIVE